MSRGSARVTIRIPQTMLEEIAAEIASQNEHSIRPAEDTTAFILRSIEERIAHRRRSRSRRRNSTPTAVVWPDEIVGLPLPSGGIWL